MQKQGLVVSSGMAVKTATNKLSCNVHCVSLIFWRVLNKGSYYRHNCQHCGRLCDIKWHGSFLLEGSKKKRLSFWWAENKPRTHALHERQNISLSHTQTHAFPCLSPQNPMVMKCKIHKLESGSVKREHTHVEVVWLEGKHTTVVHNRLPGQQHILFMLPSPLLAWRYPAASNFTRTHTLQMKYSLLAHLWPRSSQGKVTSLLPVRLTGTSSVGRAKEGRKKKRMIIIIAALIMSRASRPQYIGAEPGSCQLAKEWLNIRY